MSATLVFAPRTRLNTPATTIRTNARPINVVATARGPAARLRFVLFVDLIFSILLCQEDQEGGGHNKLGRREQPEGMTHARGSVLKR
ncbi:MAG: hypothetical protein ACR2G5_00180 [Pyrinomonadaceae bacterium]